MPSETKATADVSAFAVLEEAKGLLPSLEPSLLDIMNNKNKELCKIKMPIPIKLLSELALFYKGQNCRMKEEDGFLVFFKDVQDVFFKDVQEGGGK